MKSTNNYPRVMIILFSCISLFLHGETTAQIKKNSGISKGIHFTEGHWKDITTKAKKTGKYIFVDAYTTWCGPCKLLKSKTFLEDKAATYFNDNFINYAIDMEKGEGTKLAEQWEIVAYPTLLFFSPEGKLLIQQVGFVDGDKLVEFARQATTVK